MDRQPCQQAEDKGDIQKIKIEAVGKLIAKALVQNYKIVGLNANKVKSAIERVLDFINDIFISLDFGKLIFYNEKIADKIALNVLSGNTNYIYQITNLNENLIFK
jgi:hypothetical protein